jgi:hypothetical protein
MLYNNEENFESEYQSFAQFFMIYLFPMINGFYQLEHDTAMEKAGKTPDVFILEYVMVVLSLMAMKKFSDFFKDSLSPEDQNALDFEIFNDDSERLDSYINAVPEELHEALEEDYFGMLQEQEEDTEQPLRRQPTKSDLIFEKFYSQYDNQDASIGRKY